MSQLMSGLIWAFSFWMVADCLRRRHNPLWVVAIVVLQPYGGIVYVVYREWSSRRRRPSGGAADSVEPAEPAPDRSQPADLADPLARARHLDVADQLEEQRHFGEAALMYRQAARACAADPRALHGLGRSLSELDRAGEAIEAYESLMAIDPRYRNYSAALEYAEALHRGGRTTDAAALLEGLVEETGRINHRLALAHYFDAGGQTARARDVLGEALTAYARASGPEQHQDRHWQKRVANKLRELCAS